MLLEDITHNDMPSVLSLLERVNPASASRWGSQYEWRYRLNPLAQAGGTLGKLARSGSDLIAFQYLLPWRFWYEGRVTNGFCAMDMLVAPESRGKGVGGKVYAAILDLARHVPILGTTANAVTELVWRKAGAIAIPGGQEPLVSYLDPIRVLWEAVRRKAGSPPPPRTIDPPTAALGERRVGISGARYTSLPVHLGDFGRLSEAWSRVRHKFSFCTHRDVDYLRWRYSPPGPKPVIFALVDSDGATVAYYGLWFRDSGIAMGARRCWIIDLVIDVHDSAAMRELKGDVIARAKLAGTSIIEARGMHSEARRQLSALGFRTRVLSNCPFLLNLPPSQSTAPGSWHVVSADGDAAFH